MDGFLGAADSSGAIMTEAIMTEISYKQYDQPWRKLYDSPAWRRRRAMQLKVHPLCKMCMDNGVVAVARVADHIIPHRGDLKLFNGPLQSLCKYHHNVSKQQIEVRGY